MPEKYHENEVEHFYISCKHRAFVRGEEAEEGPLQVFGCLETRTERKTGHLIQLSPWIQNSNEGPETSGVIAFESILWEEANKVI